MLRVVSIVNREHINNESRHDLIHMIIYIINGSMNNQPRRKINDLYFLQQDIGFKN